MPHMRQIFGALDRVRGCLRVGHRLVVVSAANLAVNSIRPVRRLIENKHARTNLATGLGSKGRPEGLLWPPAHCGGRFCARVTTDCRTRRSREIVDRWMAPETGGPNRRKGGAMAGRTIDGRFYSMHRRTFTTHRLAQSSPIWGGAQLSFGCVRFNSHTCLQIKQMGLGRIRRYPNWVSWHQT